MPRRLDREPGAGAAGGLGYGAARARAPGGSAASPRCCAQCGFGDRGGPQPTSSSPAPGAFDWSTLHGSVVAGVAAAALETGRPTVLVAGECLVGRRETMTLGLAGTYAVADSRAEVEAMVADPVATLAAPHRPRGAHLVRRA